MTVNNTRRVFKLQIRQHMQAQPIHIVVTTFTLRISGLRHAVCAESMQRARVRTHCVGKGMSIIVDAHAMNAQQRFAVYEAGKHGLVV